MQTKEFTYRSSDGIHDIHAYEFIPEGEVTAIFQILHGVAEHIGRYLPLAEYLTSKGVLVFGNDHLGHGKSAVPAERGFFADENGWDKVCDDAVKLSRIVRGEYPGVRYILFGHSMGSFIGRELFMKNAVGADGYIFSGTGHSSKLTVAGGKLVGKHARKKEKSKYESSETVTKLAFGGYVKAFGEPRTQSDWISSIPEEVDAYIADEMCGFPTSTSLFIDMLDGLDYIRKQSNYASAPKDKPVLLISGNHDPVGDMGKGVAKVFTAMKKAGINPVMKLYEGRHELLHEPVRDAVCGRIYKFITESV